MKIHELAKKTGLTAPTIRFYETVGLLDSRHVQKTVVHIAPLGWECINVTGNYHFAP